jgi:hypothetical protein
MDEVPLACRPSRSIGTKSGRTGRRGGSTYLEELESLEVVAGDDIDVLAAAQSTVVSPRVWVLPPGPDCSSRWISTGGRLTGARRSSALSQLESASASALNHGRDGKTPQKSRSHRRGQSSASTSTGRD